MKKPEQGSMIVEALDFSQVYLVVDQEPKNWKDGVGVREMLADGKLGELRMFDQDDIQKCISFDQLKMKILYGDFLCKVA